MWTEVQTRLFLYFTFFVMKTEMLYVDPIFDLFCIAFNFKAVLIFKKMNNQMENQIKSKNEKS